MKPVLPIAFLSLVLISCGPFRYYTMSSSILPKNEAREFVFENDTLRVVYRFDGYEGPVRMTLFNKSSEPIEIDWLRSALILDSNATALHTPDFHVGGSITPSELANLNGNRSAQVDGVVRGENGIQFLPPQTGITRKLGSALQAPFPRPSFKSAVSEKLSGGGKYAVSVKRLEFGEQGSPLHIRAYLTLRMGTNPKTFTLDHAFYVNELWETDHSPGSLPKRHQGGADRFYSY